MKPEFVRCEFCKGEIPEEICKLAAHRTVINGKEHVFCCANCEKRYAKTKKK